MRKLVVRIFNLIFLAATAVSLAMFATKDFFAIDVSYPLSQEFIVEKLDGQFGDNIKTEDLKEAFKDGIDLEISVGVPAKSLFESLKDKTAVTDGLKQSIKNTTDNVVEKIEGPLKTVVEKVAKNMAKQQAEQSIKDQIKNCLPEGSDKTDELYARIGEDKIDSLTNEMYDAINSGEATVDSLVSDMADDINEMLKAIEVGEAENPTGFVYQEFDANSEQGQEIKDSLTNALDEFGLIDSEGHINDPETAMAVIINQLLPTDSDDKSDDEEKVEDKTEQDPIVKHQYRSIGTPIELDPEYNVVVSSSVEFTVSFDDVYAPAVVHATGTSATIENLTTEPSNENTFKITGISEGDTSFYLSSEGYDDSAVAIVHVAALQPSIKFKSETISVDFEKTRKLEVIKNEAVDPSTPVTYVLSDVNPEGCITLDGDVLTSHAEGTAKITATCGTCTAEATVKCEKIKPIKDIIFDFINGYVEDAGIYDIIDSFGGYIVYGLLALMVPWVLFALLTILRTIRKRKCWTKPWIVFTLAFEQLILGIGLFLLTTTFKESIIGLLSGAIANESVLNLITTINLSITTSCLIPSIIYLAFIPLTIVYMIVCHKVKKEFKQYKREKRHS